MINPDFDTVLIANRGEIAVRLIKACHALDLKTVAVFSDADKSAIFTGLADTALHLGPAEASGSYLDMDRIIAAARAAGAGAVHPGYGFLAENADFAQKCEEAGLVFIGPRSDIIRQMGSKIQAKAVATDAGVPVVPGYQGTDQSEATLKEAAEKIGVPLLIKASAGGGGRGMRLVQDLGAFEQELSLARQEAEAAFGDPAILLERYIAKARHIEVQVLGDKQGHCIHLFERDCSVQRNHQKIIEEAPAPNLPAAIRQKMLEAACVLSQKIAYDSAGTVEFIYEPGREAFYFLEMNTRLQVEHPVTESVTGIDIAAWQIRVALGQKLTITQAEVSCTGWAMEARIAAEDPAHDYQPDTGTIDLYEEPGGNAVRVDSGIECGSEISHHYDSMLAKMIVGAADRSSTIRKLKRALGEYKISGVCTNLPFLRDVLTLDAFTEANHHTGILQEAFPAGWSDAEITDEMRAKIVLAGFLTALPQEDLGPWQNLGTWRVTDATRRRGSTHFILRVTGCEDQTVRVVGRDGTFDILLDNKVVLVVTGAHMKGERMIYDESGRRQTGDIRRHGNVVRLFAGGSMAEAEILAPEQVYLSATKNSLGKDDRILAPMPGLVVDVLAVEGQNVTAGETLIVLEAMKLMQKLVAPTSGIVSKVHYEIGDTPEKGAVLLSIDKEQCVG